MNLFTTRRCGFTVFLLVAFFLSLSQAAVVSGEGRQTREGGYSAPKKGPLVSELREDMDDDVPGAETIIRKYEDDYGNQVREFTMNGAVFQIHVIPFNGPAYYLIDNNGDGLFETRFFGHEPQLVVPQWVLFHF